MRIKGTMFVAVVLAAGCATPYKPDGFMGGFSERQLGQDVFLVSFQGNGYTRDQRARDFLLLRCADVTLAHGGKFFRLVGSTNDAKDGAMLMTSGSTAFVAPVHFPSQSATIQVLTESEGPQDFDAAIVARSMRESYELH